MIGPLGGGALVEYASWRWIFAINVPFVLATLALVRAGVPESRDEESTRSRSTTSARCWSRSGSPGPVFALIEQPVYGLGDPLVCVPLLVGLALLAAFVLARAPRTDHPMLPLGLFRSRNFAVGNVATLLIYGGLGAATFFVDDLPPAGGRLQRRSRPGCRCCRSRSHVHCSRAASARCRTASGRGC